MSANIARWHAENWCAIWAEIVAVTNRGFWFPGNTGAALLILPVAHQRLRR
jgi:hypothetical protein